MSLVQDVAAGPPKPEPRAGKITKWLVSLSPEDRAAAEAVLTNPAWPHSDVANLFARHGLVASQQSIGTYRRARYGAR
jgi:hypothetical protein